MADPNLSSFIWSVADLLRGDYKQSEYGKVILPFTVLRRLDCVLEKTKSAVLAEFEKRSAAKANPEPFLLKKAGHLFFNTSPLDMKKLRGDQDIDPGYSAYLFRNQGVQGHFAGTMNLVTRASLSQGELRNLPICVPPIEEQREIAVALDKRVEALRNLVAEAERSIDLLKERRSALISAAVTGQIDVRGFADGSEAA
jgi:type I restriction-modification system DNA methylase subunit